MAGPPLLRRAFDRAERLVGGPLEDMTATREFADLLTGVIRLQGALYDAYERRGRAALHFLNLPALSDIRRLNRQVITLTREVRELGARLDEEREAGP